ncbi:2758_t:CDS:2 [Funneliformis geosporum]|uniref:2758_t:CDS:1 n=1 Tax=Funneliformis geosporum TaxID=1117311 RepID=A0A9W4T3F7_9GLOM|nr:2758_t:CDS:2 [Funneliformis geosporum]
MTCKNTAKQKYSDPKFVLYVAAKAPKEAVSSTTAPSSSTTSTSVPTNLDLEIVQEVFGSLPEKTMEFEVFDISNIATPNNFYHFPSTKDRSKLLDPDEYLENDDMEEDLKDFTVVTKATPFAVASHIKSFSSSHKLTRSVIVYLATSDAAITVLHVIIPNLKINTFCDFSQYKADMQFNERTIHVNDIPLQMKPANIKQVFAKYGTVTDFKMTVRGMWQHVYITYENPKCIELFYQV